ncbi:MAG TPA: formylmethanofuran dehydrogenase subunit B [Pirellulales bacterium]
MASDASPATVSPNNRRIVNDAVCLRCGCACDDIDLTIGDQSTGGQIIAAERACALGEAWFLAPRDRAAPPAMIEGRPATLAEAIERAAQILVDARSPLVYGLNHTTCEAQRVAVAIADLLGANLDTPTSHEHGPTGMAFQGVGEMTCTLGELRNRCDMLIFWGADPVVSHPRHLSRYSLDPGGMFVPHGRADRTCVVVDVRRSATAERADVFLQVKHARDFEALWTLRALAQGLPLDAALVESETGVPIERWQDLIERMKRAHFGTLLYGNGLTNAPGRYLNAEAALALTRDMNIYTRFTCGSMREPGNLPGADNVVLWSTGYPFAVNFARGYPRYSPGEYAADELLSRSEVDAALVVASDPLASDPLERGAAVYLSPAARARLASIPMICVGASDNATERAATVAIRTARYGTETGGTIYRMDDVPLAVHAVVDSPYPSDREVLARIEQRVRQLRA